MGQAKITKISFIRRWFVQELNKHKSDISFGLKIVLKREAFFIALQISIQIFMLNLGI